MTSSYLTRPHRPTGTPSRCAVCHRIRLLCRCTSNERAMHARKRQMGPPIRLTDAAGYTGAVVQGEAA